MAKARSRPLHELGAREAAAAIANGEITSMALVESCLERISAREESLQAWTFIDAAGALAEARERDRGPPRGSLHGVPVGVKDVFDTAGIRSAYGSSIYEDHRPATDAACVAMIRAAGGIVLGKTSATEFATRRPTATRNPHDLAHSPGGSSSGSAAAVADCMVPLAIGSQTGGSVIRPAAYCGVVGYLPSFGIINRAGLKFLSDSLDTVGVFARSTGDAALVASAAAGVSLDRADRPMSLPPRVGVCRTPHWDRAAPSVRDAIDAASARIEKAGASVREVVLPEPFARLAAAQQTIMTFEMWRGLAPERINFPEKLSPEIWGLLEAGRDCPLEDYLAFQGLAAECRETMAGLFADLDALLTPSAVDEAPHGLDDTGDPIFGQMWTVLHAPCVTLPLHRGRKGLPVGIQIVGRFGEDATTLAAAAWIESVHS